MKGNMTTGNPFSLILKFSIPLLLGNLFQQTYNMVDAAIVGQILGADALAAVGSSSSVQFFVLGFVMGLCVGFSIPVAQRFGAQDYSGMRRFIHAGSVWAVIMAVILTVGTGVSCSLILKGLKVPGDIFSMSYQYLLIIFMGIPFTILYNYLSGILRAIGDSRTPFLFLAFSAILNIGLDLFCILVLHLSVAGAALATIVSQAVSGICCLILIMKKFPILHIRKEDRVINGELSSKLLMSGLPMGLQFSITAIGSMVMQSANNALGTLYVSAFTAGMKVKQFMMCPFDAFATAVSTFASQNYGAMKADRVKKGIVQGTALAVGYGVVAGVVMILSGRNMCGLFVNGGNAQVLDYAYLYVSRMAMFWWILGFLNVERLAMQGLGQAGKAVFAGVIEMICRIAVSVFLVPVFGYDAITFTDQVAWIGGALYVVPLCILTVRKITHEIEAEKLLVNEK
ncbi:MAG: MATE family efflux transporter [Bulleidia sp.]